MSCLELIAEIDEVHVQALSDALLALGALSVSSEDADAGTGNERPLFGEPGHMPDRGWQHTRLSALFDPALQPSALFAVAAQAVGYDTVPYHEVRTLAPTNWVDHVQAQYVPLQIGQRIWVIPSWSEHQDLPDPNALLIKLDPGLAFGTGNHPTTRLCMRWLEENIRTGDAVLDYGCGSGILAILAGKCGAQSLVGIDIDPQALEAAQYNAQKNQVTVQYGLPEALPQLSAAWTPQHATDKVYDVVIANILLNPLISLAPTLCAQLAAGGKIVLSGVLIDQATMLIEAYQPWISLSIWGQDEEWACLVGQK